MSAHSAAPEGRDLRAAGSTGNAQSIADLPPCIIERLAREGIHDLGDWMRLGRKRLQIFGIPTPMVARIDALARMVRP